MCCARNLRLRQNQLKGYFQLEKAGEFNLSLFGPFQITDRHGECLALRSKRGKILIAALATGTGYCRTRDWLQALLWHGREKAQAANSLRQELKIIRKAFGIADIILSEQGSLQLNVDRFNAFLTPPEGAWYDSFLDGMTLPGEFEQWREATRALLSKGPSIPAAEKSRELALELELESDTLADPSLSLASEAFISLIEKSMADLVPQIVARSHVQDNTTVLRTQLAAQDTEALLRVSLESAQTAQTWAANWRGLRSQLFDGRDNGLLQLANRAQEAAIETLLTSSDARQQTTSSFLTLSSVRRMFSIDAQELRDADEGFKAAHEISASPVILGFRAFVHANLLVEATDMDPIILREKAAAFAFEALHNDPENAAMKAAVAHVFLLTGQNRELAAEIARDATELNPSNPLAWSTLANAALSLGHLDEAFRLSRHALSIGRMNRNRHWWEMTTATCAARIGDFETAKAHCRVAHALAPKFRPPLRYLVALERRSGAWDAMERAITKLGVLENGFDISYLADPAYPTQNLRLSGLA